MTAGNSFLLWNAEICLTTWVDCASAGSHATASLLSAPCSLPAGLNAAASTASQKPRTTHLVTFDDGNQASRPTSPIRVCAIAVASPLPDVAPPSPAQFRPTVSRGRLGVQRFSTHVRRVSGAAQG